MQVEIRPVKDIRVAKYNPRRISDQQLASLKASIERFGFVDPVIVNDRTGVLVGGHQRIKAAKELGLKQVPVVAVNLDEAEEKALNVALNKISGEWDLDLLKGVLDDVQAGGLDLSLTGFTEDEWLAMSGGDVIVQGLVDADDVPNVDETIEPITKLGDLWILGNHRLLCGDSTNRKHLERLMGGKKADMVFTDPPYVVSVVKDGKVGADFGIAKKGKYEEVIGDATTETARNAINQCQELNIPVQIYWGGNYYADNLPATSCWLIWDKRGDTGIINTFADCELAWTNMMKPARIYRQLWNGMIREGEKDKRVHPTQKPVALAEWAIGQYINGNIVLDLFLGSGSTIIACEKISKMCFGMELSPQYCDVIIKRWENFTGKKAVLESRA